MSLGTIFRKVRRNGGDPSWWLSKMSLREGIMPAYYQFRDDPYNGVDILSADWDNLIILDACRYDLFTEVTSVEGSLERKKSRGSSTPPFLRRNFGDETHHDIVYVTGNPMVNIILEPERQFHDVVNVWEFDWNERLGTVRPKQMFEATKAAYKQYPDKRIISHFVQPHYPFIGERALETLPQQRGFRRGRDDLLKGEGEIQHKRVWKLLEEGVLTRDKVWDLYRENLEVCLPMVEELLDVFDERSVVTSDHGNMAGELAWPFPVRVYGHQAAGLRCPELVDVPWVEVTGTTRKEIEAHPPDTERADREIAEERLRALGYTE